MAGITNRYLNKEIKAPLVTSCVRYYVCSQFFGKYSQVVPGKVSPTEKVPSYIVAPDVNSVDVPQLRSIHDLVKIRKSCQTARKVLDFATQYVKVGVTTHEIDEKAHRRCLELGVYPSPLGYRGFPKSICTSVNNVVCHGIPDDRLLQDGDIVNIDVTNGFHGDCSRTVLVGSVDIAGRELVDAAESCLAAGISICKDGEPLSRIGEAVEEEATRRGFNIIPSVAGHGIGRQFHEPPDIYHFNGAPDCGLMRCGMTFTIEPAVTQGGPELIILNDGWTAVTADGARSAQAEHTILITQDGVDVLTKGQLQ